MRRINRIAILLLSLTLPAAAVDFDQQLSDITFAAVDIETTGLSHKINRVIEVSIITFQHTNILSRSSWLINPGTPIPSSSSRVHNISDDMVKNQPAFGAVANDILNALSNSVVIAHNARFDWNFLKTELERSSLSVPPLTVIDSIALAKSVFTNQPSFTLSNLVSALGIPASPDHRAESDTLALVYLVQKCFAEIGPSKPAAQISPFIISGQIR